MSSLNFNLRGLHPEVMKVLKYKAHEENTSVNQVIIKLIEQGIGHRQKEKRTTYHDLDHLFGTWSDKDKKIFDSNTKSFEEIDKEMWT